MKTVLIVSVVLTAVLCAAGTASAHGWPYFGVGVYLPLPTLQVVPPCGCLLSGLSATLRLLRAPHLGPRLLGKPLDALRMEKGLGPGLLEIDILTKRGYPLSGITPLIILGPADESVWVPPVISGG